MLKPIITFSEHSPQSKTIFSSEMPNEGSVVVVVNASVTSKLLPFDIHLTSGSIGTMTDPQYVDGNDYAMTFEVNGINTYGDVEVSAMVRDYIVDVVVTNEDEYLAALVDPTITNILCKGVVVYTNNAPIVLTTSKRIYANTTDDLIFSDASYQGFLFPSGTPPDILIEFVTPITMHNTSIGAYGGTAGSHTHVLKFTTINGDGYLDNSGSNNIGFVYDTVSDGIMFTQGASTLWVEQNGWADGISQSTLTEVSVDSDWRYTTNSDKLVDLVNYIPDSFRGSQLADFTKFFEDFLNTMYEDKASAENKSILQKIESLKEFNDPTAIDMDYINFFARKLGYDVNMSRGELGVFVSEDPNVPYEELTDAEKEEADKYLRLVVENLPNWYRIKTTQNAIKVMLYSFGIIGNIATKFTDNYTTNWSKGIESDDVTVGKEHPYGYYPTPHFIILINMKETPPSWYESMDNVINAINSIKPINTVFDGIAGEWITDVKPIETKLAVKTSQIIYVQQLTDTDPIYQNGITGDIIQDDITGDVIQDIV